jgi:DNA-binding MarR family transcriptional regulator
MSVDAEGCSPVDLVHFDAIDDEDTRQKILVTEAARFASAFGRLMDARSCAGFSYPRMRVLEILEEGGPMIMRDVADRIGISARNMTAAVDALEDARLVVRRPHPDDRRATLIELTDDGRSMIKTALTPTVDVMTRLFSDFTRREQRQFLSGLIKLREAMACPER